MASANRTNCGSCAVKQLTGYSFPAKPFQPGNGDPTLLHPRNPFTPPRWAAARSSSLLGYANTGKTVKRAEPYRDVSANTVLL
jgi:hypothetical protein